MFNTKYMDKVGVHLHTLLSLTKWFSQLPENREFEKIASRLGKDLEFGGKKTRQKLGKNVFWGSINELIWEVIMFAYQPNSYVFLNPIGQLYQWRYISEATFQVFYECRRFSMNV